MQQLSTILASLSTLKDLVRDRDVGEIHISSAGRVRYQRAGQQQDASEGLSRSELRKLADAIDAIAWPTTEGLGLGTTIADQGPLRWMKLTHPVAKDGTTLFAVRRRVPRPTTSVLVREGFATRQALRLLERAIDRGEGLVIAGPTGSGKTRLLAGLLGKLRNKGRIVVLEGDTDIDTEGLEVTSLRRDLLPPSGPERLMVEQLLAHSNVVVADEVSTHEAWSWLYPAGTTHAGDVTRLVATRGIDPAKTVGEIAARIGSKEVLFGQELNLHILVFCGVENHKPVITGVYQLPDQGVVSGGIVPALSSLMPNIPDAPPSSVAVVARDPAPSQNEPTPTKDAALARSDDVPEPSTTPEGDPETSAAPNTKSQTQQASKRGGSDKPKPDGKLEGENVSKTPAEGDKAAQAKPAKVEAKAVSTEKPPTTVPKATDEPAKGPPASVFEPTKRPPKTAPQRAPKPRVRSIKSTASPTIPKDPKPLGKLAIRPSPTAKRPSPPDKPSKADEARLRLSRRLARPTSQPQPAAAVAASDNKEIPIDEVLGDSDEDDSTIDRPMAPLAVPTKPAPRKDTPVETAEIAPLKKGRPDDEDEPTQQTNLELVMAQARALQQQRAQKGQANLPRQPRRTLSRMLDRKPSPKPIPKGEPAQPVKAPVTNRRSTIERGVATSYKLGTSQPGARDLPYNDDGPEPTVSTRLPLPAPISATQKLTPEITQRAQARRLQPAPPTDWDPTTQGALPEDDLFALAGEEAADETSEFRSRSVLNDSDAGRYGYKGRGPDKSDKT